MKIKSLLFITIAIIIMTLSSCGGANNIMYIEDIQPNVAMRVQEPRKIRLMPGDKLNVQVFSRDRELVEMFNIGAGGSAGGSGGASGGSNFAPYTVDENGQIEMPIIGSINVKGLTRMELQNLVKYKLLASKLVRDPIVNVQFIDNKFYTLGELGFGSHKIETDQLTLLEAIAICGGISPTGIHNNVLVLRTIDGKQIPYRVDVTHVADLYSSPVYYLQQNDIIYVEPTEQKKNATSVYGDAVRNPTFWIGMFNMALSFVLMFTK